MMSLKNSDKFNGNKPLEQSWDRYPDKFEIHYNEFNLSKKFNLLETYKGKKLNRKSIGEVVFRIKAMPEQFKEYDFLRCNVGIAFVVHQKVLDKFNELCSDDIQALPIIIKNLDI